MTIPLKGGPALAEFLRAFPERLQKGALRAGAVAAARPVRDEARANARRQSGKMAKSIKTGSPNVENDGTVRIKVRLKGENSYLGYFHEYGVRPHLIMVQEQDRPTRTRRDGRVEAISMKLINRQVQAGSLKIGTSFVGPVVEHPGHSAHPFMRPALDAKSDEAIKAFGDRVRSYLNDKTGFTAPGFDVAEDA